MDKGVFANQTVSYHKESSLKSRRRGQERACDGLL